MLRIYLNPESVAPELSKLLFVAPSHYFSPQTALLDVAQLQSFPSKPSSVGGLTLQFTTGKGVFAREGLDEGTRLLLHQFLVQTPSDFAGDAVDLGCGWGAIAAFLAAHFSNSRVWGVDLNPRAVQLAAHNLYRNELTNAQVWSGDGLGATRKNCFDVALCNPPVRAGNAAIARLFADAHGALREGGALWIVLRTAQGAKSWAKRLEASWGNCETVALDRGYRVLKSRK